MLVLSSIIFLAIAGWLFFNALNEKRWVEENLHDESVSSDPGLMPDLPSLIDKSKKDVSKLVEKTSAGLQHAASDVKTRTISMSETIKQRAGGKDDKLGQWVAKSRQTTNRVVESGGKLASKGTELGRKALETSAPVRQKIAAKGSELGHKAAEASAPVRQKIAAKGNELGHKAVEASAPVRQKIAAKGNELGHKAAEASAPVRQKIAAKGSELGHKAAEASGPVRQKMAAKGSELSHSVAEASEPIRSKVVAKSNSLIQKVVTADDRGKSDVVPAKADNADTPAVEKNNTSREQMPPADSSSES